MKKIIKEVSVGLTDEEMNSPDDIEIVLTVFSVSNPKEKVDYRIEYPK